MDNETLFYICGIGLAVSAVLFSLIALKIKSFPGKAFPVVVLWFAILVGGSATFAVLHAKDEEKAKAAELEQAGKEIEEDQTNGPYGPEGALGGEEDQAAEEAEEETEEPSEPVGPETDPGGGRTPEPSGNPAQKPSGGGGKPSASAPGGTLKLAADPSAIAYDATSLSSKAGKVTIDFTNPAPLEHDVAIEGEDGKEIAASETIAQSKTSVSAELEPGTYTFFCTVPGHREAGMEGTLTVK
jgi:plastocyanin